MSEQLDFRRDINPNTLYELTSLLGEGSYGAVYKAKSRIIKSGREVAVKIIPDADDDLTSLWREIKFLQDLRSPFVVSFIESLLFDNELWLVMELCDGGSLHDLKEARKAPFAEPQIQAIMAFSVLGLAHLHSQMSIHRLQNNLSLNVIICIVIFMKLSVLTFLSSALTSLRPSLFHCPLPTP